MLERRMSKKEEAALVKQLESKIKLMDRFVGKDGKLKNLKTPQDYKKLKVICAAIEFDISGAGDLLDQGIQDLESCGMKDGNNVFAEYVEGHAFLDGSTLPADEHFGKVIKTGRYMPLGLTGRGENERVDRKRNQVRDKALELFTNAAKEAVDDLDHGKQFVGDLIDLASFHATGLTEANQVVLIAVSGSLQSDELDERFHQQNRLAVKLQSMRKSLKDTLDAVQQITSSSHVMSKKEFQLKTNVVYQRRSAKMQEIDSILKSLEEPVLGNNHKISFWKKPVAPTPLNPLERANKILELRDKVSEAIKAIDASSNRADKKRKPELEKLLRQVDYEIHRNNSALHRKMNNWEVEPVKPAKP